jgi:hypothetical protein
MNISGKRGGGLNLGESASGSYEDPGDSMLPVMSLMVILIPMLIGNMAFFQLRAIDLLVPSTEVVEEEKKDKLEQNVVVHLKIYDGRLLFDLVDADDGSNIKRYTYEQGVNKIEDLQYQIERLRDEYAKLDTCLVEIDVGLGFDWVTHVLGAVKDAFQVKIGEKYEKQLKLVLLTTDRELPPFDLLLNTAGDAPTESEDN